MKQIDDIRALEAKMAEHRTGARRRFYAVAEKTSRDNFADSIYESEKADWDGAENGVLVARVNQNGTHPEQTAMLVAYYNAGMPMADVCEAAESVHEYGVIAGGRTMHEGNLNEERDRYIRELQPLLDGLSEAVRRLEAAGNGTGAGE